MATLLAVGLVLVLFWLLGRGFPVRAADYLFQDPAYPLEERIANLVSLLTLEEKVDCLGTEPSIPRLGVRGSGHVEGLHGLAMGGPGGWGGEAPIPTTQFPQAIGLAQTWDPDLLRQVGESIGYEARYVFQKYGRGGLVVRAPNCDLGRDPRWGRTEECYGEDPFLCGVMATAFVRGLQGEHPRYWRAAALLKHFLANSWEDERTRSSSNFDERWLREYYAFPFRSAIIEGGARALMTAYNAYNGIPCTVHPILREMVIGEWGQDGIICTDAGALAMLVTEHKYYPDLKMAAASAVKAGINQFLDGDRRAILGAVAEGLLKVEEIEGAIKGSFRVMARLGLLDPPEANPYASIGREGEEPPWNTERHRSLARLVTQKSIVLLKNEKNFLPLKPQEITSLAVIGPYAAEVFLDWYSGQPPYTVSPLNGIKEYLGRKVKILYADGRDHHAAETVAKRSDVAVVCVGNHPTGNAGWAECVFPSDGKEAVDRKAIILPEEELIKKVYRANPRTVVVLVASFPYAIVWTHHHVPAILHLTHNSQELGRALAEVLFGEISPAGRLVQTWPRSEDQLPPISDYNLLSGRTYWYFSGEPLYPFGHGLSYSRFKYQDLHLNVLKDKGIIVNFMVKNIGPYLADEVIQLYIKYLTYPPIRPLKQLKEFKRITLLPNEARKIQFYLPPESLSYWDIDRRKFIISNSEIMIMIGSSSHDIRLMTRININ